MAKTRFRVTRRVTFGGAGQAATPLYDPPTAGDIVNVRELTISSDAAAEIAVYFGNVAADRSDDQKAINGLFLAANGGAAPDRGCMGAWSPQAGLPIQIWAAAACNVWVAISGYIED